MSSYHSQMLRNGVLKVSGTFPENFAFYRSVIGKKSGFFAHFTLKFFLWNKVKWARKGVPNVENSHDMVCNRIRRHINVLEINTEHSVRR